MLDIKQILCGSTPRRASLVKGLRRNKRLPYWAKESLNIDHLLRLRRTGGWGFSGYLRHYGIGGDFEQFRLAIFDPSRFSETGRNEMDRFKYLPFGMGPRTCIGASFAVQEASIILAVLMNRFDFQLSPGAHVWPVQRVTLRPSELPMTIALRQISS